VRSARVRILFVIDSLGAGGTERSTAALLPALRDLGHHVSVATLYEAGVGDEESVRALGFVVRPLAGRSYVARVRELRRRIVEFRPDIVHTALFDSDLVGRVAAWRTGAIVVSSWVNTPYDELRRRTLGRLRWKVTLAQALDAVTTHLCTVHVHAVSRGVAEANERALRINPDRVTVVERGRDPAVLGEWSVARRAAVRARLEIPAAATVVLAVGRQEQQKNHVDLVRAIDRLVDEMPSLLLLIAGRAGNATAALHECLDRHPRAAAVTTLLGHRLDVPDLLTAADVLAIPSIYEGTAGAAIEAMALRCPVVCTAVPGVAGILEHGRNALLVHPADPDALAAGLRQAVLDRDLADSLRDAGQRDFDARFTVGMAAQLMEQLYTAVLDEGRTVRS
jgi:glycosyltransferase involved in cell wall biosynthesis